MHLQLCAAPATPPGWHTRRAATQFHQDCSEADRNLAKKRMMQGVGRQGRLQQQRCLRAAQPSAARPRAPRCNAALCSAASPSSSGNNRLRHGKAVSSSSSGDVGQWRVPIAAAAILKVRLSPLGRPPAPRRTASTLLGSNALPGSVVGSTHRMYISLRPCAAALRANEPAAMHAAGPTAWHLACRRRHV